MRSIFPAAALAALLVSSAILAPPTVAQAPEETAGPLPSVARDSLLKGPYSSMRTLFEKTIFQVDVLTLDVRLGPESARRIEELVAGAEYSEALADSVAAVATGSRNAWIRIRFERDVSLEQFLDGVEDNLEKARDAGIISAEDCRMISENMPVWYSFLAERGIRDGDRMYYRIRGDSLHTQYLGVDGDLLLDQVDVGPERRLAVLGSYFVEGSDFRKGLIRGLFRRAR